MTKRQVKSPDSSNKDKKFWLLGDTVTFKVTGEDTNGKYSVWELSVPSQSGPPPHVHSREEEGFYVIEGEFSFQYGNRAITATAGTFLHLQRNIVHAYKNTGKNRGRLLVTATPAGFEKFFEELGVPIMDERTFSPPSDPPDIKKIVAITAKYGVTYVPPLGQ